MPTALLEPDLAIGGGTLFTIPVAITGSDEAIAGGDRAPGNRTLRRGPGRCRRSCSNWRVIWALAFEHVRLMSLLDLSAMMAAQLEHVGFGFAWQLVEEMPVRQSAART